MKYLILALLAAATLHAQTLTNVPTITGANVVTASDKLLLLDASTGQMSKVTFAELVNVPSLFSAYQPALVSGTNIKTVLGASVLGSGNLTLASLGLGTAATADASEFAVTEAFHFERDFGGSPSNTAAQNDAAFTAAFTALSGVSYAKLVLGPGIYQISAAATIKGRYGVSIVGAGPDVTYIRQTTASADGLAYQCAAGPTNYIEFLHLEGFTVDGVGLATSTGCGINLHDSRDSSEHFNGGSLTIDNVKIGSNGAGFETGLYFKRWDTSAVSDCRFLYNYRNVYCEAFTKTVTFYNCGNSQAESVLWHLGPSAKITLIGCDNGNSPQWYRVGYGAHVTIIGNNFETQRYSNTAGRKYNYAASTYPSVSAVSSISTTTGLITTSSSHGVKPGMAVNFGYATLPTGILTPELYEVLADGFTATTFKVAPVYRIGAVTSGSPNITVSGTRANTDDLTVGGKVRLTTGTTLSAFTAGEYWIVGKPTSSTLTVSATDGGTALNFPATGSLGVFPTTAMIPSTSGTTVTVHPPSFALEYGSHLNITDCQFTASGAGGVTVPVATLGTGSYFYSNGLWHTSGYSGTFGGRVVVTGFNCLIEGPGIPATNKLSTDSLITPFISDQNIVENEDSGYASSAARRKQWLFLLARDGNAVNDRAFLQMKNGLGLYTNEPILNRDTRIVTDITTGTAASPYTLLPNLRYRVNFAAAAAAIVLKLPDDSTAGQVLQAGDEIEIMVYNCNAQNIDITQSGATQTVKYLASVSVAGTTHGLQITDGMSVVLKCVSTTGQGHWMVIRANGTPVIF